MKLPDVSAVLNYVDSVCARFGINKKREVARLLYEIAKREKIPYFSIMKDLCGEPFSTVKEFLLKRRYPQSYGSYPKDSFYLPKIEINPVFALKKIRARQSGANSGRYGAKRQAGMLTGGARFYPKNIYVEKGAEKNYLALKLKRTFPSANFKTIASLKEYIRCKTYLRPEEISGTSFSEEKRSLRESEMNNYNNRAANVFVTREQHDFIKRCPCTRRAVCCGYTVVNIGFGCVYECSYCYLQEYQNFPGIIFPENVDDFLSKAASFRPAKGIFSVKRFGSGEFTDSLLFDDLTGFSVPIIEFFKKNPGITFEFKTKSKNIKNILRSGGDVRNIVISWSLNPQKVINENEFYSVGLRERIDSAVSCVKAGFSVGFHFDPIIFYDGCFKDYRDVVDILFDKIKEKSVSWISLGTLRFSPGLKRIIENRFPANSILDGELLLDFDGKMRYPAHIRMALYKNMIEAIRKRSKKAFVYLCMEEKKVWEALRMRPQS